MSPRSLLLALSLGVPLSLAGQAPIPSASVEVVARRVFAEAAAFHQPTLHAEGRDVANWAFQIGQMKVLLSKGTATPLEVGGRVQGLHLKGQGTFTYLSSDPLQLPITRYNLAQQTRVEPVPTSGGLEVKETFTDAVLWLAGAPLPELGPGAAVPAPREAYQALQGFFGARERVLPPQATHLLNRMPLGQLMAYREANAPATQVATLEVDGAREHWVYTFDGAHSRMESLMIQRPESRSEVLVAPGFVVSAQPIGWSRKTPGDPDFRLAHLEVDLVASRKTSAKLVLNETLQVIRPGLQALAFRMADLRPGRNAVGEGNLRHTEVQRIVDAEGREYPFDHRGGFLLVKAPAPLANGQVLKLRFEVEGDLLGGDLDSFDLWRLTPGEGWYPEPDQAGQEFTVSAKVAVEKPFIAIASAKTLKRYETPTHNVVEAALDKPTVWFSIAAGKYTSKELVQNGITVRAWGYSSLGHGVDPLLKTTHAVLDHYKYVFGNLPFDEINLVEYPSLGFGQAPAGMIWVTREAFDALGDDMNRLVASRGAVGGWVNRLISHELAHQYWGHQVKMFGQEDQWITESFAEYASSLVIKAMRKKGPDVYNAVVKDWAEQAKDAAAVCPIPMANYLAPKLSNHFRYRQALVYSKGAYLLASLHKELGDQKFITFLRAYQKNYAWYPPSYNQDVPDLLKAVTGKDYQAWFDEMFWGLGMPSWQP